MKSFGLVALPSALLLGASLARADLTLLLEEPIGSFFSRNPAHAAVYLSRVCAETPVRLRRCGPNEDGAAVSRYHRIDGYDWVAIPLVPYLYAVERADQVPEAASREEIARLREAYRENHLQGIVPDPAGPRLKDWPQLVGEGYDRTLYGFTIQTTEREDDDLIEALNSHANRNRFNIVFRNCANFAAQIIAFYYRGAVGTSWLTPGIMIPKHVVEALIDYSRRHPELRFSVFEIAQVAGPAPRSKPVRGISSGNGLAKVACRYPEVRLPTLTCP